MPRRIKRRAVADTVLDEPEASLLDVLDHVLTKGVMATGDVTLGVWPASISSTCRLSALLCATDRVMPRSGADAPGPGGEEEAPAEAKTYARAPAREGEDARAPGCRSRSRDRGRTPRAAPRARTAFAASVERRRGRDRRGRRKSPPARWNPEPEDVQKSVAQLVLTIVEFLRKLMERQAIRRMEQNTLTAAEVEAVGLALMELEKTVREIGKRFGLEPEDLNLDLGPVKLI